MFKELNRLLRSQKDTLPTAAAPEEVKQLYEPEIIDQLGPAYKRVKEAFARYREAYGKQFMMGTEGSSQRMAITEELAFALIDTVGERAKEELFSHSIQILVDKYRAPMSEWSWGPHFRDLSALGPEGEQKLAQSERRLWGGNPEPTDEDLTRVLQFAADQWGEWPSTWSQEWRKENGI